MSKASMSSVVPLILAAVVLSGPAHAQVPLVPNISLGGPDMAVESARNYRERARYPQDSYPLKIGQLDPHTQITQGPYVMPSLDPSAPVITTWEARSGRFEYPAPVDLFLSLTPGKGAKPKSAVPPARSITGEIVNQAVVIGMVDYHDDGAPPDERAGDGVYSARFTMPEARVPDLADGFNVRIEVIMADGTVQPAGSGFSYSNPHAHLTGRYRDAVRQGSLVISAEIEVRRTGRFHLAGTVASMKGEPIGSAQTAAELEPGRYWLDLQFYGLMFHDRQIAGPYKLASLVLTTATQMPNAKGMPVLNAHTTRPYRLEEMTTEPFNEPNLLDAARRLEGEAPGAASPPQP